MANIDGFWKAKNIGDLGESKVAAYITSKGYHVQNVAAGKQFDLLVDNHVKVEVKTDRAAATTGNLVFELISNAQLHRKGWMYTSAADKLMFYLPETNEIISVLFSEVRENFKSSVTRYKTTYQNDNGYLKEGKIALVPIAALESKCPSFKRYAAKTQ